MSIRIFRAYADHWRDVHYFYVQVRLFDTRKEMHEDIDRYQCGPAGDCHGQCSGIEHYNKSGRLTGRFAAMWLNREDLKANGSEIIAHECVHAAMRHVKNKNIDISNMVGEEALAYTAGNLTSQINNRLHKMGVFS